MKLEPLMTLHADLRPLRKSAMARTAPGLSSMSPGDILREHAFAGPSFPAVAIGS